jgi:glutamine amidotransferase
LRKNGFIEPIRDAAASGVPVFGICLGMQLLADRSEEFGMHAGLGLIRGEVKRLTPRDAAFRVPNTGWCDVRATRESTLFPHAKAGCYYHVHSYHFVPSDPAATAATIDYAGDDVVVAVEQDNLYGVQFHPEKSQDDGLQVLSNFFASLRRSGRVH